MRPTGRYGDIAHALMDAAAVGPATVRSLAERAQVGYGAAAYTVTRLVQRGELEVVHACRPAVLAIPVDSDNQREVPDAMRALQQAWFGRPVDEALQRAWADL